MMTVMSHVFRESDRGIAFQDRNVRRCLPGHIEQEFGSIHNVLLHHLLAYDRYLEDIAILSYLKYLKTKIR